MSPATTSVPPSRIARTLAAQFWPDVQHQAKVCEGAYWFSCAGHGGIVAHVDRVPDLKPEHVELARRHGFTELVIARRKRGRLRTYSSRGYEREGLRAAVGRPDIEAFELWVGEEDCAWATLALCSQAVREGLAWPCSYEDAHGTVQRWYEHFLAEQIGPSYTPLPDGQIRECEHIKRAQASGELFVSYAGGAQPAPEGYVVVGFDNRLKDAARRTAVYHIPSEVYTRRSEAPFPFSVTLGWLQALYDQSFQQADLPHIGTKRVNSLNEVLPNHVLQAIASQHAEPVDPETVY